LHASSVFYDITPTGRILNRFSKDIDSVDNVLPSMLQNVVVIFLVIIGNLLTVASVTPIFLGALAVAVTIFFSIQGYFTKSTIQLQRIESNTRSPIFQHFTETLKGGITIRAFRQVDRFKLVLEAAINRNNHAQWLLRSVFRWSIVRIGLVQAILVGSAGALVSAQKGVIDVGLAGVALSYVLSTGAFLNFLIMLMAELQSRFNSVERLQYYSTNVPQESAWQHAEDATNVPNNWPHEGKIEFSNMEMSYRPGLPPVLKNVSAVIQPQAKIGLVGRTGSGKSSLMLTLMRMYELQHGKILIDGIDISKIGLHTLRSKLGVVPQDPVIFSGSIRGNLDPFHNYTDEDIMNVLDEVSLKQFVLSLEHGLQFQLTEYGGNLSAGQKQLLCMARVLLKKPKILLLDEATSSVDSESDSLIQKALRSRFKQSTCLTIAHRLNTIMDSDAIMVMDDGKLAEYDTPAILTSTSGSIFGSMHDKFQGAHNVDSKADR
jgi:ABC-type multidrug transport system fused ATPase/permease subunit